MQLLLKDITEEEYKQLCAIIGDEKIQEIVPLKRNYQMNIGNATDRPSEYVEMLKAREIGTLYCDKCNTIIEQKYPKQFNLIQHMFSFDMLSVSKIQGEHAIFYSISNINSSIPSGHYCESCFKPMIPQLQELGIDIRVEVEV